jgi:sn-glycerol 3-phosphate transport system substrate-binding protein
MAEPSRRSVVASSLGCTALVVVLVVGCSRNADDPPPDPPGPTKLASCEGPPQGQKVTITFAHPERDDPDAPNERADRIAGYVAEFEAAHPDIHVDLVPYPDGADALLGRWRRQAPAERPDLVMLPQQASGRLIDSGQTVAPGGCSHTVAKDMLPAINRAWSAGGVLQAMPFAVSTPVLLFNRRVFTAAALDPDSPPETLGELRTDAIKMVQSGAAAHGFVFDTGPESGASWMLEQLSARAGHVALAPDNGRGRPATSVTWREGTALENLDWLDKMVDNRWAVSVGRNPGGLEDLYKAALDPDSLIGMGFHTCGALGQVFDMLDAGLFPHVDLGVAPLPRPDDDLYARRGHGSLPGGSALWLAAGKSEAETAAAWQLAAYLGSAPVQADWAAATGVVPISSSAARSPVLKARWEQHPEMRVAYTVLAEQAETPAALGPRAGPLPEIHALEAEALDLVVGGSDPAEALTVAADDADKLLQAYADSRPG